MIENFHLVKAVKYCLRNLLKGNGFQDSMVKKKVFGVKTAEAVLSEGQYVAICGVVMIP